MMITARLILLILAAIAFGLAAAVVPTRVNLTALGLLLATLAFMFT